jgi:hypothetical protein
MATMADAAELYDDLTDDLLYDPAVGRSTMMGYPCVRRAGRFFASFDRAAGALVVKLPSGRVGELIADGTGEEFAPNGRVFREWVRIPEPERDVWERLLAEAHAFAAPTSSATGFDPALADRVREVLSTNGVADVREQRMFGGLAFMIAGHLAIAVSREGGLLLSVDRALTPAVLRRSHTQPMVMRGRELDGWVRIDADGVRTKRQLVAWVRRGVEHATSRPPKPIRRRR